MWVWRVRVWRVRVEACGVRVCERGCGAWSVGVGVDVYYLSSFFFAFISKVLEKKRKKFEK